MKTTASFVKSLCGQKQGAHFLPHHTHTCTAETPPAMQSHTGLRRNPIQFPDEPSGYIQTGPFFLHLAKYSGAQSFSLVISVVKNISSPFSFSLSEMHNTVGKTVGIYEIQKGFLRPQLITTSKRPAGWKFRQGR